MDEVIKNGIALFRRHSGMVGRRRVPFLLKEVRDGLDALAGEGVDDPALRFMVVEEIAELVIPVLDPVADGDLEVVAVDLPLKDFGTVQAQQAQDVLAHMRRRRRGKGGDGDPGKEIPQLREGTVVGPKFMPPFTDTVRFVNDEVVKPDIREDRAHPLRVEAFGGEVEEVDLPGIEPPYDLAALLRRLHRGEHLRAHPLGFETLDLVVHEGEQRGDDDGRASHQQGGQLVGERFPAAGGQDHQQVTAREDGIDGFLLQRTEGVMAEAVFEDGIFIGSVIGHVKTFSHHSQIAAAT